MVVGESSAPGQDRQARHGRRTQLDAGKLFGAVGALWGFAIGAQPLFDNSLFTHLVTGRLILQTGTIPSSDPYSFTAPGIDWVVQSWLVSWLYAGVEAWFGVFGLRLFIGFVTGLVGVLVWQLTRPARTIAGRMIAAGFVLAIGSEMWSGRPLVVGLALLCVALLAADGRLDPRWLVPAMWLWVNSHGSFPLGLVALGCLVLGRRLDGGDARVELSALRWAAIGTLAGVVSPVGPKLLLFPVELLQRADGLRKIVEWSSPDFSVAYGRIFLVQLMLAVLLLVRRPSWRAAIPMIVFGAAALFALRNITAASIVLVPGMARGLRDLRSIRSGDRSPVLLAAAGLLFAGLLAATVSLLGRPAFALGSYPQRAVAWLDQHDRRGAGHRLLHSDVNGNYLELLYGPDATVFFDDRVDMYPPDLLRSYVALLQGRPGWEELLDRCAIDTVLWDRTKPLSQLLAGSPRWRITYQDDSVMVAERRGPTPPVPERC